MALDLTIVPRLQDKILQSVLLQAQWSILAPAMRYIPVDTGTAQRSGQLFESSAGRQVIYVSFGSDDDINPKSKQHSNEYIVVLHENMEVQHRVGQAQFLLRAMYEAIPGFAKGVADWMRL